MAARPFAFLVALWSMGAFAAAPAAGPVRPVQLCAGDYADGVPEDVAARIAEGKETFVFAIRNTATYEHVFYGRDGRLRRSYLPSVIHGTGFAYRRQGLDTLVATNEHVAAQPEVTDDDHKVEGIPRGSKKVREHLAIVRNEDDDYEPGHVALTRVLIDASADVAVLRTRKALPVMPHRFGRSGALRAGNLVQVRGFPLGVFSSLNSGKVTNPSTEDGEKGWAHTDFMIDALVTSGNSGSPVFAISCKTGEPELVGIYHAGYSEAAALNAVVAVDQLREELETLRPSKRDARGGHGEPNFADRARLVRELSQDPARSLTFSFAGRAVIVRLADAGTLRFGVLDEDFPLSTREALTLVDRARTGFGTLSAVEQGGELVRQETPLAAYGPDVREHFQKLYEALWHQLASVVDYRQRLLRGPADAEAFSQARSLRLKLRRRAAEQKELLNVCTFEADRATLVTGQPIASAPGVENQKAAAGDADPSGADGDSATPAASASPVPLPSASAELTSDVPIAAQ